MNIVKINEWCEALELRMQKILHKIGYDDNWMSNPNDDLLCAKDVLNMTLLVIFYSFYNF